MNTNNKIKDFITRHTTPKPKVVGINPDIIAGRIALHLDSIDLPRILEVYLDIGPDCRAQSYLDLAFRLLMSLKEPEAKEVARGQVTVCEHCLHACEIKRTQEKAWGEFWGTPYNETQSFESSDCCDKEFFYTDESNIDENGEYNPDQTFTEHKL